MTAQTFPNNGGVSYVGTVCENPVYANAVMSFKWSDEVQKEGETKASCDLFSSTGWISGG